MLSRHDIARFISEDFSSKQKEKARKGQAYYEGKHDIESFRLFYFNSDGQLTEDRYRSNVKIPHPFFTEIVSQAVQYIFSDSSVVRSDNGSLQRYLDEYFNNNEEFINALSELLTGCMAKGCEYMYMYRNKDGRLSFQTVDSLCVTEVPAVRTDDNKEYLIYSYNDITDKGKRKVRRIQVWDRENVHYFQQGENGVVNIDDSESLNPQPHIVFKDENGEMFSESFGFIPFFRFDNNKNRLSDLWIIKELIDDYDLMASSLSNNLIDFDMPLYAVTGFEGDSLDELQQNLKSKKIIGLDEGGGIDVKTIDVPYQARKTKLELDEKNIYRFGMALNTDGLKDTSATTNVAIRAAYSLLDLKCSRLEMKLKAFLRELVKPVIAEINQRCGKNFSLEDVHFEFRHEVMTNAYENAQIGKLSAEENQIKVQTILEVSELLDDETVVRSICRSLDVDYYKIKDKIPEKRKEEL